jgi:hypothetical protein
MRPIAAEQDDLDQRIRMLVLTAKNVGPAKNTVAA